MSDVPVRIGVTMSGVDKSIADMKRLEQSAEATKRRMGNLSQSIDWGSSYSMASRTFGRVGDSVLQLTKQHSEYAKVLDATVSKFGGIGGALQLAANPIGAIAVGLSAALQVSINKAKELEKLSAQLEAAHVYKKGEATWMNQIANATLGTRWGMNTEAEQSRLLKLDMNQRWADQIEESLDASGIQKAYEKAVKTAIETSATKKELEERIEEANLAQKKASFLYQKRKGYEDIIFTYEETRARQLDVTLGLLEKKATRYQAITAITTQIKASEQELALASDKEYQALKARSDKLKYQLDESKRIESIQKSLEQGYTSAIEKVYTATRSDTDFATVLENRLAPIMAQKAKATSDKEKEAFEKQIDMIRAQMSTDHQMARLDLNLPQMQTVAQRRFGGVTGSSVSLMQNAQGESATRSAEAAERRRYEAEVKKYEEKKISLIEGLVQTLAQNPTQPKKESTGRYDA